jgi:hypothetical protein
MPGGNLKRSSSHCSQTHLELANTSTAATDNQARSKKNKTKSPEDATEQARRSKESEKMIEPADGDAEDFEDDSSAWKWEIPCLPVEETVALTHSTVQSLHN